MGKTPGNHSDPGGEAFMNDLSQELVKEFLNEAFELLDNLEKCLLELEKNPTDDKSINEVFRAAHTIKGGAGTVGFPEIQELTHTMEDVLDLVRKKSLSLTFPDVSVLLKCRDELERMLTARENNGEHITPEKDALLAALRQIKESNRQTPVSVTQAELENAKRVKKEKETEDRKVVVNNGKDIQAVSRFLELSNYDLSLVNEFLGQNRKVYFLKYSLNENYEMKGVSAFQIFALLNDVSEIIKIHPNIELLEKDFFKQIGFVIASDRDAAYIKDKTWLRDLIDEVEVLPVGTEEFRLIDAGTPTATTPAAPVKQETVPAKPEPAKQETPSPEKKADIVHVDTKPGAKPEKGEAGQEESIQKRNVSTLRVESWKVDELMNLLGELVITKATFSQINADFDRISGDIKMTLKEFVSGIMKLSLTGEEEAVAEKNRVLFQALSDLFTSMDSYSESIQKLNRISSSLQENVMNMRMVPIQMVFSRFPRLIRDIADRLGKQIELTIEGVETEIDKGIVDDIFDPLIHILRNAVDHGIEDPETRRASGKPETGRIILKAIHEGDSIVIEVSDDGKGFDTDALKRKAVENGFVTREAAEKLTPKDILGLAFLPGLSTAQVVSDLSGRGVGMDVVKKKIEEIGGNVGLSTVKGKGTKISIRLPLTLAIIQGLLIVVNGMHYVIPVASVEETVIINVDDLKDINGRYTMELRGKFVPVMSLVDFFYGQPIEFGKNAKQYCIVARYSDNLVGILVSEVVGEQDIVIKPLNTKLIKSTGISAATIVGNGEIGYIVDTSQIIGQFFRPKS
jgi:two-component system chemotaxis sensor kinase CheA